MQHSADLSAIPDQANCDFSTYDEYSVVGGRLFEERPKQGWTFKFEIKTVTPTGGICTKCIATEDLVERLLPYLNLEP